MNLFELVAFIALLALVLFAAQGLVHLVAIPEAVAAVAIIAAATVVVWSFSKRRSKAIFGVGGFFVMAALTSIHIGRLGNLNSVLLSPFGAFAALLIAGIAARINKAVAK